MHAPCDAGMISSCRTGFSVTTAPPRCLVRSGCWQSGASQPFDRRMDQSSRIPGPKGGTSFSRSWSAARVALSPCSGTVGSSDRCVDSVSSRSVRLRLLVLGAARPVTCPGLTTPRACKRASTAWPQAKTARAFRPGYTPGTRTTTRPEAGPATATRSLMRIHQ